MEICLLLLKNNLIGRLFKDYVNLNPLVNIDVETYSGIGCYIPHDGYDNWNNYFKNLSWYTAAGWDGTGW